METKPSKLTKRQLRLIRSVEVVPTNAPLSERFSRGAHQHLCPVCGIAFTCRAKRCRNLHGVMHPTCVDWDTGMTRPPPPPFDVLKRGLIRLGWRERAYHSRDRDGKRVRVSFTRFSHERHSMFAYLRDDGALLYGRSLATAVDFSRTRLHAEAWEAGQYGGR